MTLEIDNRTKRFPSFRTDSRAAPARVMLALGIVICVAQFGFGQSDTEKLTDENFSSAMADIYFQEVVDRGGVNKFAHLRQVSSVETQNIIRENRDTLYSWGIFDVKGGLEITLPPSGDLYMSALVIDNDTYIVREEDSDQTGDVGTYQAYSDRSRTIRISHKQAVTDFVYVILRTQTDATPEGDQKANRLQDAVAVKQGSLDIWKSRNWVEKEVREKQQTYVPYLAEIVAKGTAGGYNERGKTIPFHHNFYSAIGWGGQLERYASYGTTPDIKGFGGDGAVVTIQPPNVDYDRAGFWSYQVYGLDGYIHSNNSTLNNQNTEPNDDGSITLRFGPREAFGTDVNRADKPDEGFSITTRFYNRKGEIDTELLNPPLHRVSPNQSIEDFRKAAQDSYVYGLGIVAMYRYYSGMAIQEGALNRLVFGRSFLKPGDKPGSGPNVDTYYSYGWFDLTDEPMVVSLPAFGDRYYVYQLTDIYGHNFHNVGNGLSSGSQEKFDGPYAFVITPPGWNGEVPDGLDRVESTGKLVNVLYRIRVTDEASEAKDVHQLQDETLSLPLSAWVAGKRESIQVKPQTPLLAMEDVLTFKADATGKDQRHPAFFEQLSKVLQYDPPANHEETDFLQATLSKIGFDTHAGFSFDSLESDKKEAILDGQEAGYDQVQNFIPNRGSKVGTAVFTSGKAGNYGNDWMLRSAMVLAGAMYPTTEVSRYADIFTDGNGDNLSGANTYTITFRKNAFPPVTTFWSLTIYGLGTYDLVENPINRYKIGPETPGLAFDDDGSLTITLANKKPTDSKSAANWLPIPEGGFYAMVRFYAPTQPILDLEYLLPAVVRE